MKLNIDLFLPSEERKTTVLSASLLFTITAAFIILKAARDALFLGEYPATALPYFMGITALATALIAVVYLRLYKIFSLSQAVDLSLKAFSAGTLILWAGIKSEWQPATPILYVWVGIFGSLAPVQAWSIISQHLLRRQARRSFGFIGAGGIAGASAGGFFAKFVAESSSVSALLPTATILILLTLFAAQALSVLGGATAVPQREEQKLSVSPRFVTLVLIVVSTGNIVSTIADFQFKYTAQKAMATAESLAPFFGSFYAYIGIVTLVFQIAITPSLMNRIGLAAALAFLPLGLAAGNVFILTTGTLGAAVLLKGSDQLFKHSIYRSSLEVVYMAIPEQAKIRSKSLIDTVGVRVSEVAAALLLVALFSVAKLPPGLIAMLCLILLAISIACSYLLGREYPKALRGAIRQDEVNFTNVRASFFTTDFFNLVPELLTSKKRETILDLLQLLENTGNRKIRPYLQPMLNHPEADIRLKALKLLFTQEEDLSEQVEKMVSDSDRRVRVEAIHYLCFRSSIDPLEKLAHLLTDPEPTIQAAACACSLNQEMEPVQQMAYQRLEQLLQSENPASHDVRLEVAHVLEYVRPSASSIELCRRLLLDSSVEVRKITLHSISKNSPQQLLLVLLGSLDDSAIRLELRSAVASYGEAALQELAERLKNPEVSLDQKKLILRIVADIGTPRSADLLLESALGSNLVLRFVAIKALNRFRKRKAVELPREKVFSLLEQEFIALEIEQERLGFIAPRSGSILDLVLNQRQLWALERIFRVLGLVYEPSSIYSSYLALISNDKRRADTALEFLDTTLIPEHRHRLLRLIEKQKQRKKDLDPRTRKNMLFGYLGARDELPAAAIVADLTNDEMASWKNEITQAMRTFGPLPLVEETLNWRYSQMETSTRIRRKLTTIEKLESLNRVDIFSELGPQESLLLANQCEEVEFEPGQIIFKEGDAPHELYALVSGNIQLSRPSGQTMQIKAGESFGTLSVLSNQPRLFTATALEHSLCLKIKGPSFWDVLEDYPALSQSIFRLLARRIRSLTEATEAQKA